jgi:hypothetical protein
MRDLRTIRIRVQLTEEEMAWLRAEAERRGVSMAAVLREGIRPASSSETPIASTKKPGDG